MAMIGFTVTLGAAATQFTASELYAVWIRVENEAGNALVKIGGSAVSAADYYVSVPADTATVSNGVVLGPSTTAITRLDHLYGLGTVGQKFHVTALTP